MTTTKQALEMTPAQLCTAIMDAYRQLPVKDQRSIERCYQRTFALVRLVDDELAVPTDNAHARLAEVLAACEYDLERRGEAAQP